LIESFKVKHFFLLYLLEFLRWLDLRRVEVGMRAIFFHVLGIDIWLLKTWVVSVLVIKWPLLFEHIKLEMSCPRGQIPLSLRVFLPLLRNLLFKLLNVFLRTLSFQLPLSSEVKKLLQLFLKHCILCLQLISHFTHIMLKALLQYRQVLICIVHRLHLILVRVFLNTKVLLIIHRAVSYTNWFLLLSWLFLRLYTAFNNCFNIMIAIKIRLR
jgi:hypothetical protein